jgi:hypothetical protein
MRRTRMLAFTLVCVLAVVIAAGAVLYGAQRAGEAQRPTAATALDTSLDVTAVRSRPHIVFRSTATGPTWGQLAVVPLDHPDGPRAITEARCERVYASRADGLCLTGEQGPLPTPRALLLDRELVPGRQLPLSGIPSRTRVSRDGTLAAMTTFVEGHSYAHHGFSTATTIHDTRNGRSFGNLEEFRVLLDGKRYRAVDLNVWGVTFATGERFYATVASRGRIWLAEGDLARRELRILREDVECPSLSPDGTRVAYKKRSAADAVTWRLHVMDLRTGRDVALAETRNVDDQVEWLDDGQVLYGRGRQAGNDPNTFIGDETDVWVVPADGSGQPRIFLPRAWSPAVVR